MTSKPAAKKAPDDVYTSTFVHPSQLDVGPKPDVYETSIQSPLAHLETVPVVVPADLKES